MVRRRDPGFSLVEVTIALGIAAFALAAIVGLLSVTLKDGKSALDDTLIAEMARDIVNTMRKETFTSIPTATVVYFDNGGKRANELDSSGNIQTMSESDAISQGAVYQCTPVVVADAATTSADSTVNLWRVTLNFKWPVGAAKSINEKTIQADIARY
jgi:uncharacterized protein (TIGR02598 family)